MPDRMVCPKCGFEQPATDSCLKCGINISKFKKHPSTKKERDQIESSLEQSLGRYFTTSVKEDEQVALIGFQQTLKRYLRVMCSALLLCLIPGGMVAGIVGSFIVYRCPVCGLFLWLSPKDPGYTGHRAIQIYPPPEACPDCKPPWAGNIASTGDGYSQPGSLVGYGPGKYQGKIDVIKDGLIGETFFLSTSLFIFSAWCRIKRKRPWSSMPFPTN